MSSCECFIKDHEKLTAIFGCWPSFHDAEVIELHYWRGVIQQGDWHDSNVFPVLTVTRCILQVTQKEYSDTSPDILATLRFYDVDDFKMDGFNHINQIFEFAVTSEERGFFANGEKLPPYLVVSFARGCGINASFRCFRIEVLDAVPYKDDILAEDHVSPLELASPSTKEERR